MTNGMMKADSLSIRRLMAEIAIHPGLTVAQLSARCGMSGSYVHKCLRFAVHHEMLGCVHLESDPKGKAMGWYTAADLPIVRERWEQIAAKRAEDRTSTRLARLQQQRGKEQEMGAQPVHRIIKAGSKKPLPFRVKAARSVFDLGAA